MRDVESGSSKGFAFINFASFEASDAGYFIILFSAPPDFYTCQGRHLKVYFSSDPTNLGGNWLLLCPILIIV